VTSEGEARAAGNTFSDGRGEAFTVAMQNRLEQCILQNDTEYKASIEKKFKGDPKQRRKQKKEAVGPLLEGARRAFSAFVRAYPAKEKAVRHIFNARALHLGHVARSLALKDTPKMVSKVNSSNQNDAKDMDGKRKSSRDKCGRGRGEKRKSQSLAFGSNSNEDEDAAILEDEERRNLSLLGDAIGVETSGSRRPRASKKSKSSASGGGGGMDTQKRMMEAAMLMQSQEFM
jgi:ATP-dependent RNA helicase DDX31/DBP7